MWLRSCVCAQKQYTALHLAALDNHVAIVRLLVRKFGAEVDATNMVCAASGLCVSLLTRMLICQRGETPLHYAAIEGNAAVARTLVCELGANVNAVDTKVMPVRCALCLAARC